MQQEHLSGITGEDRTDHFLLRRTRIGRWQRSRAIGKRIALLDFVTDIHKPALGHGEAALARIHGPVGLDIGALSPAEIALSIMGQVTAIRRGGGTRR